MRRLLPTLTLFACALWTSACGNSSAAGFQTCDSSVDTGACIETDAEDSTCDVDFVSGRKCPSANRTSLCTVAGPEDTSYFYFYSNYTGAGDDESSCTVLGGTYSTP